MPSRGHADYLAWGSPPGKTGGPWTANTAHLQSLANLFAASSAWAAGPGNAGAASFGGATAPEVLQGETQTGYMGRVLGGHWRDSSHDFDLGRPSSWGKALEGLADALSIVADAFGLVGAGQFIYLLHAVAGNGSPAVLAASLKTDYDELKASDKLAEAIQNGDWKTVWNTITADGTKLEGLKNAWGSDPAPDVNGNLTIHRGTLIPPGYVQPKPAATKVKPMPKLLAFTPGTMDAAVKKLVLAGQPADSAAEARLAAIPTTQAAAMAVGLAPPPATSANPTAGRTFMGIPVLDLGIGAAALGALGFLLRKKLGF